MIAKRTAGSIQHRKLKLAHAPRSVKTITLRFATAEPGAVGSTFARELGSVLTELGTGPGAMAAEPVGATV